MKKKVIVLSVLGAISLGGLAYGHSIPGVTRPYDPGAYYSETEISYRDSPSPFTLMDLARNGFQVRDVTRKIQSELSQAQTYAQSLLKVIVLNNKIKDMTGVSADVSEQLKANVNKSFTNTQSINMAQNLEDTDAQSIFRTTETVGDPRKTFDWKTQQQWLNGYYKNTLNAAQNNLSDTDSRIGTLENAIANSDTAEGRLAAQQTNTEVNAMYATETARRNILISNMAGLEAAHTLYENDEELHAAQDMKNSMTMRIADPDKLESTDQKYKKPQGKGFLDF